MAENHEKDEMKEKKEKFLEQPTKKQQKKPKESGLPLYLIAMFLVLGLLGGYAISIFFGTAPIDTPGNGNTDQNTNDITYRTVPVTIIYSKDCANCREGNTIEDLFAVRQIPYSKKLVEASSAEGISLLERFPRITSFPTAIVDATKLEFYPTTKINFDGTRAIMKATGVYLVPELNLNDQEYYPIYYKEKAAGFCGSAQKPTIVQFDDYYSPGNTAGKPLLYDFVKDYNEAVEFKYSFAQTVSTDTNSGKANLFLMCAADQGKYIELEQKITGIYCNNPFSGDETLLTQPEVEGCSTISNHYATPLTQIELDIAIGRTSIDQNSFKTCIEDEAVLF
ncbi:MAG: hypothetical protein NUV67_05790, partial [archaeon]|nr:hypothetical protein [archaeon]